ncbi:MAG: HIT domain-containing protein [Polyangiaceae bacterium]|jgi:ATP adenylyltransferase
MSERLWAPWRMEYILRDKDSGQACIFCNLAAIAPSAFRDKLVLVVQSHAFVCLNRYPFAGSHVLVVPRAHTSNLDELSSDAYVALLALVRESVARVRRATEAEGINVGLNLGKAAGAGIAEHLHWHVVPRWAGDSNFMPVVADVRIMPEYLDHSWQRLEPWFADLPGEHPADPTPSESTLRSVPVRPNDRR